MTISPDLARALEAALRADAPGFDITIRVVDTARRPGQRPAELVAAALALAEPPLHLQPVEPAQVLRQLHDSFAGEPGFLIGAAAPAGGRGVRDLARELSRQVARCMRSAVQVHEFWLTQTQALYERERYAWEFAYLFVQPASATVLIGHSQAGERAAAP
ncbi:MAG: hypothetical protein KF863_23180 [Rubrivivax sp.]|nr:hypothetical protein [Rubrivivax sp.]